MPPITPSTRSSSSSKSRPISSSSHAKLPKHTASSTVPERSLRSQAAAPRSLGLTRRTRNGAAVSTDLSAYPRTDPTGALNTLVKLITSLATRVGGCQYKLTLAEHTLSLHLLSIVEPYVYQGARTLSMATNPAAATRPVISGFAFQPTEILDAIMYHVDSKRDLMNLGLCCKRLHDVVFPRHFDYRVIRCKVSSISVWNHLSVHRSLARNVRRLEILDERAKVGGSRVGAEASSSTAVVVPRGITQRDTDLDSTDDELRARGIHAKQERYLLNALHRMTGLKEFKWSCNHSPISMEKIWAVLMARNCVTLERMEVCNNLVFTTLISDGSEASSEGDSSDEEEEQEQGGGSGAADGGKKVDSLSTLSGLKTITFTSSRNAYGAGRSLDISRIAALLQRCPNVENLSIDYTRGPNGAPSMKIDPFFLADADGTRWSRMTNLRLGGLSSVTPSTLSKFLSHHPTLQVLNLVDLKGVHRLTLPPNSIPRLREIQATREVIIGVLESPCYTSSSDLCLLDETSGEEVLRPLESVKGFNLSGSRAISNSSTSNRNPDQLILSHLHRHSGTINRVELGGWHDMDDLRKLAKSVPGVTYLDLGKRLGGNANAQRAGAAAPVTNLEEWLEILVDLKELKALHGVKFFYEVSALNSASGPVLVAGSTSMSPSSLSPSNDSNSIPTSDPGATTSMPVSSAKSTIHSQTHLTSRQMSLMDRSRMKKNDWTASMLVWRCPKLRKVDHWESAEPGSTTTGGCYGKIIVLTRTRVAHGAAAASSVGAAGAGVEGENGEGNGARESTMVKWEVRRVRAAM